MVFDLFVTLGATDVQLDFPIVYTIGREGIAKLKMEEEGKDLIPLFETIIHHVQPYPDKGTEGLQLQITSLAYDDYIGRIGIGRVTRGTVKNASTVAVCRRDGKVTSGKITKLFTFEGLQKIEIPASQSGDIVAIAGIPDISIGDDSRTRKPEPLPLLEIDEPTGENYRANSLCR